MKCKKCSGELKKGFAMGQTYTGIPDFPGGREIVTMSPGGPGKLIKVWKCKECGWSISR